MRPKAQRASRISAAETTPREVCCLAIGHENSPILRALSSYHVTLLSDVYRSQISSLILSMARAKPLRPSPMTVTIVPPRSGPPAGVRVYMRCRKKW